MLCRIDFIDMSTMDATEFLPCNGHNPATQDSWEQSALFGAGSGTTESQNASRGPPKMPNMRKRARQPYAARIIGEMAKPMRLPR